MTRVILQVLMSKELKDSATAAAAEQGFSSLQEIVRVMLNKVAKREFSVTLKDEPIEYLTPKAEKRYEKIVDDIEKGKNITKTDNVDDLLKMLRS